MSENYENDLTKDEQELVTKRVPLTACAVGIGYAGSYNAQEVYEKLDIPVFVLNTSSKDLSNAVINKEISAFLIGTEGRGAGNDRMKAKAMFKENGKVLLEKTEPFIRMVNDADICFVIFSSAGGTGSGIGPDFVRICRAIYPNKNFIPVVIAPKLHDSPLSQYNNLECINEIDTLEGPYIIGDLEKFATDNDNIAYKKISEWVIESIRKISGMDMEMSVSGMMDENDLSNVIGENGYLAQYTVEVNTKLLETQDIQDLIIKRIKESPAMAIQKDHKVSWGGIIVNVPDGITDPVTSGDFQKLTEVIGEPKHMYKNFTVSKNTKGSITLIISGLSIPYNRLSDSTAKVKEYMRITKESQRHISLAGDIADLSGTDSDISFGGFTKSTKKMDDEDAVAKNKKAKISSDAAKALSDYFD